MSKELANASEPMFFAWRPWLPVVLAVPLILVAVLAWGAWRSFSTPGGVTGQYHYGIWQWERTNLPNTLLRLAGFGPHPDDAQARAAVTRYFALTSQLGEEQAKSAPDQAAIAKLDADRKVDVPVIDAWFESVVSEAYASAGVRTPLPLFSAITVLWPPLAVEVTQPVHVLVRSDRDHIDRLRDTLLSPNLTDDAAAQVETANDTSTVVTLAVPLGGIASYPSMDLSDRSYEDVLFTAAHEWVHQYLAFYPLGLAWNTTSDAVVLNETAADIVAPHIAQIAQQLHPVHLPAGADGNPPPGPAPTINFDAEMHALRLQVDALLANGQVTQAEQLMEQKREYFVAHGFAIRKLNQAYFAFYGTYADQPESVNPIGQELQQLWNRTQNAGDFLRIVRDCTSRADLEAALVRLGSVPAK